jgi:uncharacterized protein (TIGR00730 family)
VARPRNRSPLAYRDDSFMDSSEGRPVRILAEYLQPLRSFRREGVRDTIVFFGSARIDPRGPLREYYAAARELARLVTRWSAQRAKGARRYMVCSGGGPGIMEAANRGASDAGGRSIGLNIGLPHEQAPNPYISQGLSFEFRYFFMRKLWFSYLARAFIAFPGGFGTLDELFEIITLCQTHKLDRPVTVLLYGTRYWRDLINFDSLVRNGMIDPRDMELIHFVDSPGEALALLKRHLEPPAKGREATPTPAIARSVTPSDPRPPRSSRRTPPTS